MRLNFDPSGYSVEIPDAIAKLTEEFKSGMMDSSELLHLAGTLALYPWNGDAILVEIGAYIGQTTVFMAKALRLLGKQAPILSIDPFERAKPDPINPQGIYSAYLKNTRANHVEDTCLPLVAFSEHAAPVVPEKIGVLVIDGSHRYEDVTKDLKLYVPKLLPGGLVFIDDYVAAYPGVMRAVDGNDSLENLAVVQKTYFFVGQRAFIS